MSGLFGGSTPKLPPPTPAPPPPTVDEAAKAQQQNDQLRQRRGAAANVLSGNPMNGTGSVPLSSNVVKLLGQ